MLPFPTLLPTLGSLQCTLCTHPKHPAFSTYFSSHGPQFWLTYWWSYHYTQRYAHWELWILMFYILYKFHALFIWPFFLHILKVNRGLLSSAVMSSYIVFLCWSTIQRYNVFHACSFIDWMFSVELKYFLSMCSEPPNDNCKTRKWISDNGDWTTILVRYTSKLVLEWLVVPYQQWISLYNFKLLRWIEF